MKRTVLFALAALVLGGLQNTAPAADAPTARSIKQNMQKRQPELAALLRKGVLGEANDGYLAARGTLTEEEKKLADAENQDRKTVYSAIAKQQNTTVTLVGQRRAKQIAERAASGIWIQNAAGEWSRK